MQLTISTAFAILAALATTHAAPVGLSARGFPLLDSAGDLTNTNSGQGAGGLLNILDINNAGDHANLDHSTQNLDALNILNAADSFTSQGDKTDTTVKDTKIPIDVKDTNVPVDAKDAKVPVDVLGTNVPVDVKNTNVPVDAKDTKIPVDVLGTKAPVDVKDTKAPINANDNYVEALETNTLSGNRVTDTLNNNHADNRNSYNGNHADIKDFDILRDAKTVNVEVSCTLGKG